MKNFTKLVTILVIFLNLQFANAQNADYRGFELTGKNPKTIQLNQTFTQNTSVNPFTDKVTSIYGLAVKADISFSDEKGLIQIILVDQQNEEYLIYEAYPMLEEKISFSIDNLCEETGALNNIKPQSLKIEVKGASLSLKSITFTTTADKNVDIQKVVKEKKNLQNNWKINQINKSINEKKLAWVAGETEISYLSYSEKKKLFGQSTFPSGIEYYVGGIMQTGDGLSLKSASISGMVENWDWRSRHGKNWVTDVKNQGSCGSCWAFAATGATEAQVNLFYNQLLSMDLSEQNILSCSGAGSCSGGYPSTALDYIKNTGIVDEAAFPYSGTGEVCTNKSSSPTEQFKIGGRVNFGSTAYPTSEDNLKKMIIQYGPISGGLLNMSHAMTLVGWKVVKEGENFLYYDINKIYRWATIPAGSALIGKTVWLFKNSWGATWGDKGYFYVETDVTNFAWTHALIAPVQSLKQNYTVQCVDNDHDGYYWWGLGAKPAGAPACPNTPDGNDADATLGPLDSNGNCISLNSAPAADFTSNISSITTGEQVNYSDLSTNSPTSWSWTFNGGTPASSTLKNPVVTYSTSGVYSVTLRATNAFGEGISTKTNYITVSAPQSPVADFGSDKTVILEGQAINLADMSSSNPTSWSWSIPGGTPSSSTLKNPAVTYKTAGKYDVTLVVTNANGNSTKIKTGYITVNANAPAYCVSKGNATAEWIGQVSMNGSTFATNTTGATGYANLTANVFNVTANDTYSITLTPKYTKANFWYWNIWIDLNNDFDFNDSGEQILTVSRVKTVVNKSITIPATSYTGPVRMRVSMKRGSLPTSCEVFSYGEVKDFTVNISASLAGNTQLKSAEIGRTSTTSELNLSIFPNPTERMINLRLDEIFGNEVYSIYNVQGAMIKTEKVESNLTQVDVSNLPAGIYVVKVENGEQTIQKKLIKK